MPGELYRRRAQFHRDRFGLSRSGRPEWVGSYLPVEKEGQTWRRPVRKVDAKVGHLMELWTLTRVQE